MDQFEKATREAAVLRERLSIAEAAKIDAEERLQRLLSQTTPASAADTANAERDARLSSLEQHMSSLSTQMAQIANERSVLLVQLETFKGQLAAIVETEERDVKRLLAITAEKIATLDSEKRRTAETYQAAIRTLQIQIEEKETLRLGFEATIAKLEADKQALLTASRRFEGNGYTALFDIIAKLGAKPIQSEIDVAEREIIAIITHSRILAPTVPFSQLMQLDGQKMWISRLLGFCKYTDTHVSGVAVENQTRPFSNISPLLMEEGRVFVKKGSLLNYDNPSIDGTLSRGGLLAGIKAS